MKQEIINNIIETVHQTIGDGEFTLHEPHFIGNEKKYLNECIDTNFVSSVGNFVNLFEKKLSEYLNVKHVILTNSGTSALHSALVVAGIKENDEVLLPSLTFVATANAVLYCNAIPHFVDSETLSLGVDTDLLEHYFKLETTFQNNILINKKSGNHIKAILPVHTFGHACKIDEILEIAKKYNLIVIEDAAEAIGSTYKNKSLGTFGDLGTLSFNGNKTITTGAGGAILTNNSIYAEELKHITTTAKVRHQWKFLHDKLGYNFRMPNVCAALGLAQLENIDKLVSNKRILHQRYRENFINNKYAEIFCERKDSLSNYWFNSLVLKDDFTDYRDDILIALNDNKVGSRPCWELMHNLPHLTNFPKTSMLGSEEIYRKLINLPSSASI